MSEPPLVPTDKVGGPVQSDVLQHGRSEARAVALVTDDNDALVVTTDFADAVRARGVESPFQNVSVDDDRSGQFTFSLALFDRSYVYDQSSGFEFGAKLVR